MKNIEALIADGGEITIGAINPIECARRNAKRIARAVRWFGIAIAQFYDGGEAIDEINGV